MSAGPLNHIATLVEQQSAQLFQQYQQQLLALAQKPELQNALSIATQLIQSNFVQNIKDKLAHLVGNLMQSRSALSTIQAKQEAEQELEQELVKLKFDLGSLASSVSPKFNVIDFIPKLSFGQWIEAASKILVLAGKRDLVSSTLGLLGLDDVFQTIVSAGQGAVAQLTNVAIQLVFAGQKIWQQAQAVLAQLHSDLLSHADQAKPIIANAVAQLTQIIAQSSSGKRSIQEFALNVLGENFY